MEVFNFNIELLDVAIREVIVKARRYHTQCDILNDKLQDGFLTLPSFIVENNTSILHTLDKFIHIDYNVFYFKTRPLLTQIQQCRSRPFVISCLSDELED